MAPSVRDRIESISKRTGCSMSEAVSRALAVYDEAIKNQQTGGTLVLKSPDGAERQLLLIP